MFSFEMFYNFFGFFGLYNVRLSAYGGPVGALNSLAKAAGKSDTSDRTILFH